MLQADQRILLLRHPETQANVDGLLVGRSDSPWTELGHLQAKEVLKTLQTHSFNQIISSPIPRALRLAELVGSEYDCPIQIDERFTEIDFGRAEGLSYEEVRAHQLELNYEQWDQPVALEAESRAQVDERVQQALSVIMSSQIDTLVVAHGGTIRSALTQLLCLEPHHGWSFSIRNTGLAAVSIIEMRGFLEMLV